MGRGPYGFFTTTVPIALATFLVRHRIQPGLRRFRDVAIGEIPEEWVEGIVSADVGDLGVRFKAPAQFRQAIERIANDAEPLRSEADPDTAQTVGRIKVQDSAPTDTDPLFVYSVSSQYPLWAFPETVRSFFEELAEAYQVPAEMTGTPLLAIAGGTIGHRCGLRLKRGWIEYPALWTAVVAPPGAAKSPALRAARRLVEPPQAEALVVYRRDGDLKSAQ